ncbi:MAG: hypothetical protein ACXWJB_12255, partial [Limisphaerales bacterium]
MNFASARRWLVVLVMVFFVVARARGDTTELAGGWALRMQTGLADGGTVISQPGYSVADCRLPGEMPAALDRAFAVSRSSWKGKLGTDMSGEQSR